MSKWYSGCSTVVGVLAQCTMPGLMPASRMEATASWKRRVWTVKSQSVRRSAVAKWVNTPSNSTPRSLSAIVMNSAADSGLTPMRSMPVSTARW